MQLYWLVHRAVQDLLANKFIHCVAITTICLIFVIEGSLALVLVNVSRWIRAWQNNVRVMVYMEPDLGEDRRRQIEEALMGLPGVRSVAFVSKQMALERLKVQLKRQTSLLEGLETNPLPDAFELLAGAGATPGGDPEALARRIESLAGVEDVEYGQAWLHRFTLLVDFLTLSGLLLGGLLLIAAFFITSNTIRLVLYNRQDEIHIMRLVGATDRFINTPFYIQGVLQGGSGGLLGLGVLTAGYGTLRWMTDWQLFLGPFEPRFLPPSLCALTVLVAMAVGYLGCYLSLRHLTRERGR